MEDPHAMRFLVDGGNTGSKEQNDTGPHTGLLLDCRCTGKLVPPYID